MQAVSTKKAKMRQVGKEGDQVRGKSRARGGPEGDS